MDQIFCCLDAQQSRNIDSFCDCAIFNANLIPRGQVKDAIDACHRGMHALFIRNVAFGQRDAQIHERVRLPAMADKRNDVMACRRQLPGDACADEDGAPVRKYFFRLFSPSSHHALNLFFDAHRIGNIFEGHLDARASGGAELDIADAEQPLQKRLGDVYIAHIFDTHRLDFARDVAMPAFDGAAFHDKTPREMAIGHDKTEQSKRREKHEKRNT